MSKEYPEIKLQDNPKLDTNSAMVILVPICLLISEVGQRFSVRYISIVTFPRVYALIVASSIVLLAKFSNYMEILHYTDESVINDVVTCLFVPIEILFITTHLNIRMLFRKLHVVLMLCATLIISAMCVSTLLTLIHGELSRNDWLMIAVTMSSPQPQALMDFLAVNESYQTILNYMYGECLIAMLFTVPFAALIDLLLIEETTPMKTVWIFLFSPCVGMITGWLVAKVVIVFVSKVNMSLESFCCVLMGVLIFMYVSFLPITFSTCGYTSAMAYCLVICSDKDAMRVHKKNFPVMMSFMHQVVDLVVFFFAMVKAASVAFEIASLSIYIYCYLLLSIFRIASSVLVYVIFKHSQQLQFIHLIIFAMVNPTGNYSLKIAREFYLLNPEEAKFSMAHTLFNVTSGIVFNYLVGINLLKWTHKTLISKKRVDNMEIVMKRIKDFRNGYVNGLMKDRSYAEANWATVYKYGRFRVVYPYPKDADAVDWEHTDNREYNARDFFRSCCDGVCPAVSMDSIKTRHIQQTNFLLERVVLEMVSMVKRMKEHCLINGNCEKTMLSLLPLFKSYDHDILEKFEQHQKVATFSKLLEKIRLLALQNRTEIRPRRRFYRICFLVLDNRIYNMIMYTSSMMCFIFPIVFSVTNYPKYVEWIVFDVTLLLSFSNFVVNIGARSKIRLIDGIRTYLSFFWGLLDFVALLAIIILCICAFMNVSYIVLIIFGVIASSGSLRKLILIMYGSKNIVDMYTGSAYECAIALNICLSEAILFAERVNENELVTSRVRNMLTADKIKLVALISRLRLKNPLTVNMIMTQNIMEAVRCCKLDYLQRLNINGIIDRAESAILKRFYIDVSRVPFMILAPSPSELFQNVPWMNTNKLSALYLKNEGKLRKWGAGQELCRNGEAVNGVYLLISGQVRVSQSRKLRSVRGRPYFEFPDNLVIRGNSFGEIDLLLGGIYQYTAVCEVDSCAYYFPLNSILHAMTLSCHPITGMDAVLWKCKMLPQVSHLFMTHPLYRYLTQWQIDKMIQKGFVPDLRCYKDFVYVDAISDLVLVYGVALNSDTNERYIAPQIIPRTCRKLTFSRPNTNEKTKYMLATKLLIIPMGKLSPNTVLAQVEAESTLITHDFLDCMYHVAVVRGKMKHRISHVADGFFTFSEKHTATLRAIGSRKSMQDERYADVKTNISTIRSEKRQ